MRRLFTACLAMFLCSSRASAAGPEALDLASGVPKELLGKTLGIAWSLFAFSLVAALLVELFGSAPAEGKSYGRMGSVAWRALVVVALLKWYPLIFGTVINAAETIAGSIAPKETWEQFAKQSKDYFSDIYRLKRDGGQQGSGERGEGVTSGVGQLIDGLKPSARFVAAFVGGPLFDVLAAFLVLIAQAFHWAFAQLSRILIAVFYVLGPLAIVFAIPRASDSGAKWFRAFVTVASWPIFSSLLLAISTSLMFKTDSAARTDSATAFGALASSLLMVVLNLAVPILASAIVGGSVRNVITPALEAATGRVLGLTRGAITTAQAVMGSGPNASQGTTSLAGTNHLHSSSTHVAAAPPPRTGGP